MPRSVYEFDRFTLEMAEHRLLRDGQVVPLTPKMFDLLRVLVEHTGHLVEKEHLIREVWGDTFVEEGSLTRGISVLRKVLGETEAERYIETVPKRGYRFVAAIREPASDPPHLNISVQPAVEPSPPRPALVRHSAARLGATMVTAIIVIAGVVYFSVARPERERPTTTAAAPIHRQLTFTGRELTPALAPDGKYVAYVSDGSPNRNVVVQPVDGGEPIVVFTAPEAVALRWSPDSSELLFGARGNQRDGMYIASRAGGTARKIASGLFLTCWSPDGSTLAMALHVRQQIRFVNRLGEEQRTIALSGSHDWIWDLDWSAVHGRLLFVATDEQRRAAIWSIRPDGTDQRKMLSSAQEISAARWTSDGESIYYFSRANQTVSVLKVPLRPDLTAIEERAAALVSGLEADGAYGLSADAHRLVYARSPYYANLWLVEADPGSTMPARTTPLTSGTAIAERPRVSPDGESILFNMGSESRANLYTMPAGGGPPTQLTFLNAFSGAGVWSSDGRTIAFASTEGGSARIWIVNADGSAPRPLPTGPMSQNFDVAWAPGARILYQQADYQNIYSLDPRTLQQHLLLRHGPQVFVSRPEYSPDGQRILVYSSRRPHGLWILDTGNLGAISVRAEDPKSSSNPLPLGWSADSRAVYVYDGKRAAARGSSAPYGETITAARIDRIPLNGAPPTTIVELPFEEIGGVAMFPDGRRFVVSVYSSRSDVWVVEHFDTTPPRALRVTR
jgi:DNA-binding winged helix-turn-helix (wHTH) protein/Tol biopolymer transport system component